MTPKTSPPDELGAAHCSACRDLSQRGDHFPWHCPSCGEWETTYRTEATWWESFWKGWGDYGAFECPRCSHRYPL